MSSKPDLAQIERNARLKWTRLERDAAAARKEYEEARKANLEALRQKMGLGPEPKPPLRQKRIFEDGRLFIQSKVRGTDPRRD